MSPTSNEIGDQFEERVRDALGGRRVPMSGAGWVALDVKDAWKLVVSCKATTTMSSSVMRGFLRLWREAVNGSRGLRGHGDGAKPALCFELEGEAILVIRLDDFAEMATGEASGYISPSKGEERRARANRSLLG